jgi:hypothetical protein
VRNIKESAAGIGFLAEVLGTQVYNTALDYDEAADVWECDCDCPVGDLCKHGYALMKTLLDRASPDKITESLPLSEMRASSLMNELSTALGRKLGAEEITFLRRLEKAFAQAKASGGVYVKDLAALGWRIPGFHWDRLALWPAFPADEREFWLYLVLFLEGHGLKMPEFVRPISDPGPLRERVAKWRRNREIERWQKLLSRLREDEDTAAPVAELDLRLRFRPGEAVIEARRGEAGEFEPMKAAAFRDLPKLPPSALTHEAALLAHYLHERADYGYSPAVPYREQAAADLLGELLRLPWLESRLVGESGTALARPADPLCWQLDPAADETGDYRLRLVLPDGHPAGPFLFVVEGTPTLYLTSDAVWKGPIIDAHALTPGEETIIPAAALETGDGVRFLRKHGVELPARLRERIRTVTVKPLLRCELQPTYAGSSEETCVGSGARRFRRRKRATRPHARWLAGVEHGGSASRQPDLPGSRAAGCRADFARTAAAQMGPVRAALAFQSDAQIRRDLYRLAAQRAIGSDCRIARRTRFVPKRRRFRNRAPERRGVGPRLVRSARGPRRLGNGTDQAGVEAAARRAWQVGPARGKRLAAARVPAFR